LFLLTTARGQVAERVSEHRIEDLPPAVQDALEKSQKGVEVRRMEFEIERGGPETLYLFEFEDQDRIRYWVNITERGEVLREAEEGQLSLREGLLYKQEQAFWIQSIHKPRAADPAHYPEGFRKAVYALSEVGANTLAFDLVGLSSDGSSMPQKAMEHLHRVVAELLEYRMSGVCRLLGSQLGKEPASRRTAIRTIAVKLRNEPQLVYWIDGEDAGGLVAEFKRLSPNLVVAGPGGDLMFVNGPHKNPAAVSLRHYPEFQPGTSHVLLQDQPESFEFLEMKNRLPIESEHWLIDDSLLSSSESRDGFKPMFDGATLNGWTSLREGKSSFVVKDGVIEWVGRGAGAIQFYRRFGDFVLRFEYRIAEGGNSGVHLRSPRANRASRIGFEVQLMGDFGSEPSKGGTGAIYSVVAPRLNASAPAGEWNAVEVTAKGPLVKVILNGHVVQDVDFDSVLELRDRLRRGFIRLTDHGDYVAFRNIRIKEL
jgi:hypothetical protein